MIYKLKKTKLKKEKKLMNKISLFTINRDGDICEKQSF